MRHARLRQGRDIAGMNTSAYGQVLSDPINVQLIWQRNMQLVRQALRRRIFWKEPNRDTRPTTIGKAHKASKEPARAGKLHLRALQFERGRLRQRWRRNIRFK